MLPMAGLLWGCVNLTAVRHFAAVSGDGQALAEIAAELPASPERRLRYTESAAVREQLQRDVVVGRQAQRALLAGHRLVLAYLDTLADLAGDGGGVPRRSLDALTGAVQDADVFAPRDVEAFQRLAVLLGHGVTDWRRQATLRRMLVAADEPLQAVLAGLVRTVRDRCVRELETERKMAAAYYGDALRDTGGLPGPGVVVLLREARDARLEALDAKIQRCRDYAVVLEKIGVAHAAMVRDRNPIGRREWLARLREYAREIEAAQSALRWGHR